MRTSVSIPTFLKHMGIMGPEPGEIARNVEGDPQAGKQHDHARRSFITWCFFSRAWWDKRKRGYTEIRNPLIFLVGSTGLEPVAPAL